MDELVLRGMTKWPNVPAVFGWLSLDRRGNWLIKGETISNSVVSAFISRNYERDSEGRWFFQNGPQRVFVSFEYTPLVYRAVNGDNAALALESHVGGEVTLVSGAWIDENGALLIETEHGIGLVHDHDLEKVLPSFIDADRNPLPETTLDTHMELLQHGRAAPLWLQYRESNVAVEAIQSADVPQRFDFNPLPSAPQGAPECA
jgi:hypothetical protein